MSKESLNENGDELDRYCGYILNSQSDEAKVDSQPLVHDSEAVLPLRSVSPYSLQPLDPFSEAVHPLRPVSPYGYALQTLDPLFGAEFSGNSAIHLNRESGPIYQELTNATLPYAYSSSSRPSNVDEIFLENQECINGHGGEDMYGHQEYTSEASEAQFREYEDSEGDIGEYEEGEIENIEYEEGVNYDDMEDYSAESSSYESSERDEEEVTVIDSDTDADGSVGSETIKELSYCEYPVGKPNTVIVTEKDYRSLEHDEFLNDIIIDFYLAYLFDNNLPPKYHSEVHMFSTMFYKRLLQMPNKKSKIENFETDSTLSIAEKRHRRVSGWTKNLDIFSKSVVVFPICENSHWYFLMVVGLSGNTSSPFIIVLDSLGGQRKRAARNVRKYLDCEFQAKNMEGEFGFSDVDIPSIRPEKPLQPNMTDCGVYLLHHIEKIFASLSQFLSPELPCLKNWFTHEEVQNKRKEVAALIRSLAQQQTPHQQINFPDIPFSEEEKKDKAERERLDEVRNRIKNIPDQPHPEEDSMLEWELSQADSSQGVPPLSIQSIHGRIPDPEEEGVLRIKANVVKNSGDSTSTSRDYPVSNDNHEIDTVESSKYCKSYSKGFKIPRIKKADSINAKSRIVLTESVQKCLESLSPKRQIFVSKKASRGSHDTSRDAARFNLFEDLSPNNPQIKKQDVVEKFMSGASGRLCQIQLPQ